MKGNEGDPRMAFSGLLGERQEQAATTAIFVNLTQANSSSEFI